MDAIAHAVFHIVLFLLIHGNSARFRIPAPKPRKSKDKNSAVDVQTNKSFKQKDVS
jgi:hypothetical protein